MPNGIDAVNFRKMPPESISLDLETDDTLTHLTRENMMNPFEKFNSSKFYYNNIYMHICMYLCH